MRSAIDEGVMRRAWMALYGTSGGTPDTGPRTPDAGHALDGWASGEPMIAPLATAEVSRQDVRLVVIPRRADARRDAGVDARLRDGFGRADGDRDSAARGATRLHAFAELPRRADDQVALGATSLHAFAELPRLLRAGDLVVVNDAATLPASLSGRTARGEVFELRLSAPPAGDARLVGVLFGSGDWRTRTEHRPPPPRVAVGERVTLGGTLEATVANVHGRRVVLDAGSRGHALWQALYAIGVPVQYAHRSEQLALWSVQTAYASRPWAVEMPSAGRALTWDVLLGLRRAGIGIATLTHAAGLGSTGDEVLDRAMPWPERYDIPARTAAAIRAAHAAGGRVVAIGTTVVRALEASGGAAGQGIATLRLDRHHQLAVVDGLVSGLHVPGESHFDLLEAFVPRRELEHGLALASQHGLSAHELGDACLIL